MVSGVFSRLSLTAKVAVVIVAANLTGLAVTTWLSWSADLSASMERAEKDWSKATQQIGATAEGAVKWKKASVIQEAYALYRNDPSLGLVAFLAVNAKLEAADGWAGSKEAGADHDQRAQAIFSQNPETIVVDKSKPGEVLVVSPLGLDKAGKRIGYVAASWSSTSVVDAARNQALLFAAKQALVIAFVIAAFLIAMRQFAGKPLGQLARRISGMQDGDLVSAVPMLDRADAVGVIARALDGSITSIKEKAEQEHAAQQRQLEMDGERARFAEQSRESAEAQAKAMAVLGASLEKLASGNFSARLGDIDPDFEKLRSDFNTMVAAVAETLSGISDTAFALDGGAADIASSADQLAKRTEIQAAALEETAAALEEITSTVTLASEKADQASKLVLSTKQNAHGAAGIVRDAVSAMDRIQNSSSQIGKIIGVIDEIAFQTNLLALNAGVEAARAGDAGKGFAVVAQEVRELAQRSASAAKEIKQLVSASGQEVGSGVSLVNSMGNSLLSIESQVNEIHDSIAAIVSSSKEQAMGLNEVNNAIRQMDQATQQNAAMVEETNAACQELQTQSNQLKAALSDFQFDGTSTSSPARMITPEPIRAVRPVAAPVRRTHAAPVIRTAASSQSAAAQSQDWEEF
ncbi:methyl-accepting chemotaxis protein [Rhizobium sp. TH2]|uniref:methyl-accepting chemotaxis protein n=1 Tax=Rhizobium sp. TH2 TaxID=2775403 RepID=UPI0021578E38|nr:methyl-accepting chemotaxis protein [Rhizobium sp. TH2]UVC11427.1 methyl-accepting chemotaxis protein [Rhizobium sp. TH2]